MKKLNDINNILIRAIERLNDDELMNKNPIHEIKRCNAISQGTKVLISSLKTKVDIAKMKDSGSENVKNIEKGLGFEIE